MRRSDLVRAGLAHVSLLFLATSASAAPVYVLDQFNEQGGTTYQIDYYEVIGQEFRPSLPNLAYIELWLLDLNDHIGPVLPLTLNLRRNSIDSIILATASVMPGYGRGSQWDRFTFATPVDLTPGALYVFDLQAESARGGWMASHGAFNYPQGVAYRQGVAYPNEDFMFRTFALTPEPSSWILILVALAGLAAIRSHDRVSASRAG